MRTQIARAPALQPRKRPRPNSLEHQATKRPRPKSLGPQATKRPRPKSLGPQTTKRSRSKSLGPQTTKRSICFCVQGSKLQRSQSTSQVNSTPTQKIRSFSLGMCPDRVVYNRPNKKLRSTPHATSLIVSGQALKPYQRATPRSLSTSSVTSSNQSLPLVSPSSTITDPLVENGLAISPLKTYQNGTTRPLSTSSVTSSNQSLPLVSPETSKSKRVTWGVDKQELAVSEAPEPDTPDPPDHFRCPITLFLMRYPVTDSNGHKYEGTALASWFTNESPKISPLGGHLTYVRDLNLDEELQKEICTWAENHEGHPDAITYKNSFNSLNTQLPDDVDCNSDSAAMNYYEQLEDIQNNMTQLTVRPNSASIHRVLIPKPLDVRPASAPLFKTT